MKIQGSLLKMTTELNDPVDYFLQLGDQKIHLNDLINKEISITYLDEIHCIRCGRKTNKSFHQGYCIYSTCFPNSDWRLPQNYRYTYSLASILLDACSHCSFNPLL